MLNIVINNNKSVKVQIEAANIEELEAYNCVLQKVAISMNDTAGQGKKLYKLFLTGAIDVKLQCVKAVKESLNLGLKEAKDLVDVAWNENKDVLLKTSYDVEELRSIQRYIENSGSICNLVQEK